MTYVPDRESIILALQICQREWESGVVDDGSSLAEHLVDDMVLPLIQRVVVDHITDRSVEPEVDGKIRGVEIT